MAWFKNLDEFMNANGYIIGGIWYPRVTAIVAIKAKPALYKFYGDAASFGEALSSVGKSASEGTKIHEAIESILAGQEPTVEAGIMPAINAFKDFLAKNKVEVSQGAIEKRIWNSDHKYAGTVDAIVHLNGEPGILDIKTSAFIWRDYNLQTAAYMAALQNPESWEELPNHPIETRWILRVDQAFTCRKCGAKKRLKGGRETIRGGDNNANCEHSWGELLGEWEIKELTDFENDFGAFLAAKKLWEWENKYWLKQIGY